ncbi:porin family protein [Cytophagales bacterium LB-30]|uniref:Porin family protein n=1 Tax=Shiella aurantiaca TaxID=3058365 RepID=A0ABT8F6Z9_9BACT|nr:porin family protein [Shiella aurantiaca]MDN4166014.1 porin family protein [Shiella aurantiaca]
MRTFFLCLCIWGLVPNVSQAQKRIEAVAGMNLSKIYRTQGMASLSHMLARPHVGFLYTSDGENSFGLQSGLILSQRGERTEEPDTRLTLSYLEIPLLFSYIPEQQLRFHLGPSIGLLLHRKLSLQNRTENLQGVLFDRILDVGVKIGASHQFTEHLSFSAYYFHSLLPIEETPSTNSTSVVKLYNQSIQISLGYTLWTP